MLLPPGENDARKGQSHVTSWVEAQVFESNVFRMIFFLPSLGWEEWNVRSVSTLTISVRHTFYRFVSAKWIEFCGTCCFNSYFFYFRFCCLSPGRKPWLWNDDAHNTDELQNSFERAFVSRLHFACNSSISTEGLKMDWVLLHFIKWILNESQCVGHVKSCKQCNVVLTIVPSRMKTNVEVVKKVVCDGKTNKS